VPEQSLPGAVAALFPSIAERTRLDGRLSEALREALARVRQGPVTPDLDMARFGEELAAMQFDAPLPLEHLLEWTIERMEHGIVQMTNPRYFGLFNPGASFPSQCADRIASVFNPQLASSASSPVPVALESRVIRAVASRAGFGAEAIGHFATGGSEANYTALVCALTAAHPRFAHEGARAFPGAPVFYTSRECHIAWLKIAHQAGVGRGSLRLIATDGTGRIDPRALAEAIRDDRAAGACRSCWSRPRAQQAAA
jgi:glutamate/tyrosine decarboxylase-like PLP-dependent enzyme